MPRSIVLRGITILITFIATSSFAQSGDEVPTFKHPSGFDLHTFLYRNIDRSLFSEPCLYTSGFARFTIDSYGRLSNLEFSQSIPETMQSLINKAIRATDTHWSSRVVNGEAVDSRPFLLPITISIEGACKEKPETDTISLLSLLKFRKNHVDEKFDGIILAPLMLDAKRDSFQPRTSRVDNSEQSTQLIVQFVHPQKYISHFLHDRIDLTQFKEDCYFAFGFIQFSVKRSGTVDSVFMSPSIPDKLQVLLKSALTETNGYWSPPQENRLHKSNPIIIPVVVYLAVGCPRSATLPQGNTSLDIFQSSPVHNQILHGSMSLPPLFLTLRYDSAKFPKVKKK